MLKLCLKVSVTVGKHKILKVILFFIYFSSSDILIIVSSWCTKFVSAKYMIR